jgi:RNA polymerase sigma-B factor
MAAAEIDFTPIEIENIEASAPLEQGAVPAELVKEGLAKVIDLQQARRRRLKLHLGPNENLIRSDDDESKAPSQLTREQTVLLYNFLPMAKYIAYKSFYAAENPPSELDSMMSDAYYGLIRAVDKFDKTRFPSLSLGTDFFYKTIHGEVGRGIRDRYGRVSSAIDKKTGERAENAGKTARLKPSVTLETAKSFDQPLNDHKSDGMTFGETLASDSANGSETSILMLDVERMIQDFAPRQKEIFVRKFYLDQTLAEISEIVGLSSMQVSRLLKKMQAEIQSKLA